MTAKPSETPQGELMQRLETLRASLKESPIVGAEEIVGTIITEVETLQGQVQDHVSEIKRIREEAAGDFRRMSEQWQERFVQLEAEYARVVRIVHALRSPPQGFVKFVRVVAAPQEDLSIIDVIDQAGNYARVFLDEGIDPSTLRYGQRLITNEHGNVVAALEEFEIVGEEGHVDSVLKNDHEGSRVLVSMGDMETKQVVHVAANVSPDALEDGNRVLVDTRRGLVVEALPRSESQRFLVEEIPDATFNDIGGLGEIIDEIQEDFVWPMMYPNVDEILGLSPLLGFVLEGPPGVGKTMIAKAIVNFLRDEIAKRHEGEVKSHFFHIRGSELLHWLLGRQEFLLRQLFEQAKRVASSTNPVVIFFDEIDALFPTRGSRISSSAEQTLVPQFTTLMDGLEARGNVIVIAATNRVDLLDRAILRAERFDRIVTVHRPGVEGAKEIFRKHLKPVWGQISPKYNIAMYRRSPFDQYGRPREAELRFNCDPEAVVEYLIDRAVARMYDPDEPKNRFVRLRYQGQARTEEDIILRYGDFSSGAVIAGVVKRAKRLSRREHLKDKKELGVELAHLYQAIERAFSEMRSPSISGDEYAWLAIEGHARTPIERGSVRFFNPKMVEEEGL